MYASFFFDKLFYDTEEDFFPIFFYRSIHTIEELFVFDDRLNEMETVEQARRQTDID